MIVSADPLWLEQTYLRALRIAQRGERLRHAKPAANGAGAEAEPKMDLLRAGQAR